MSSSDKIDQQERAITRDHVIRMLDRVAAEAAGNNPDMTATKLASLRDPAHTSVLDLSGIGADDLAPGALVGFDNLRRLNLSANALASLDAERLFHGELIEKKKKNEKTTLPPLTWLKLSKNVLDGNNLRSISRLTQLTTLSLSYNKIVKLPREALKTLVNLKALVLDHNEIEDLRLPKGLKGLSTLIVSHNKLKELDTDRVLSRLPALTKLSAAGNQLTTLPDFSHNPLLIEIRLAHNELTTLPEPEKKGDFGRQLARLRLLDLSSNRIEAWKDLAPLAELPLLSSLSLKHNPVTGVPVPSKSSSASTDAAVAKKRRVSEDNESKGDEGESESEDDVEEEDDGKTTAADLEKTKSYVGKLVALVPRVQHVDYKPLASYGLNIESVQSDFRRKWTAKEERRKRNLVSDKLFKPDPSKPRNKPCSCGSGLKYKMCCEKNPKEATTAVSNDMEVESESADVVVASSKRKRVSEADPVAVAPVVEEVKNKEEEEKLRKAKKASKQKLLETLSMNDAQRRSGVVAVVNAGDAKASGESSKKRSRGGRRAKADVAAAVAAKQVASDAAAVREKTDVAAALRAKKAPVIGAVSSISAPAWD